MRLDFLQRFIDKGDVHHAVRFPGLPGGCVGGWAWRFLCPTFPVFLSVRSASHHVFMSASSGTKTEAETSITKAAVSC